MVSLNNILKTCKFCGLPTYTCFCPTKGFKNNIICNGLEKAIKRHKWITILYGQIETQHFKLLKKKLGTGGNLFKDRIELRGKVLSRALDLIKTLGYETSRE